MRSRAIVYVVDDDPGVRATLAAVLDAADVSVEVYESANDFLNAPLPSARDCILLDVFLPDMSGIDLHRTLRARGSRVPVVMITGHADVPLAVQAMKNGAIDFIEKPFEPEAILEVVARALESSGPENADAASVPTLLERIAALTDRERAILMAALSGQSSKEIARELSISPRTVDVHRGNVLKKLGIKSTADLIRLLLPGGNLDRLLNPSDA